METNKNNPFVTILGGALSGMAVAFLATRRDIQAGEPTVIDKVKQFERKLYADGQSRAETFERIKVDAEMAALTDASK